MVACRKFDFEYDHRLKVFGSKEQSPFEVPSFTDDEVKAVLTAEAGDWNKLTVKQREMLRTPQNLSLFIESELVRNGGGFFSQKHLLDAFWETKRKQAEEGEPTFRGLWKTTLQKVAEVMSDGQALSLAPKDVDDCDQPFLRKTRVGRSPLPLSNRDTASGTNCFSTTVLPERGQEAARRLSDSWNPMRSFYSEEHRLGRFWRSCMMMTLRGTWNP